MTKPPEPRLRLFVAIELPESHKKALADIQDKLRTSVERRYGREARVRWVRPEGMHLTLKFLGATEQDRLPSLLATLGSAVAEPARFGLTLVRVTSLEGRRGPSILVVDVGGETASLNALAERIDSALSVCGWPREKRRFRGHITLGRLPDEMRLETRRGIAREAASVRLGIAEAWSVERVSLMRSRLRPGGASYERVATFPG